MDVRFDPPEILRPDGPALREPPERVLQVVRLLRLPADCEALRDAPEDGFAATVRLTVAADGRADVVRLTTGSGHDCIDGLLLSLADDLRYGWLPDERYPAPVRLDQPITLVEAVETVDTAEP